MAALITDVKNEIKSTLEGLVRNGTLGELQVDDFRTSLFDRNIAAYPCAILTPPYTEQTVETNRDNIRAYTFDVFVVEKQDNVSDSVQIEELQEAIFDAFDNAPTLNGKANAGLDPAMSQPEAVTDRGQRYIAFSVTLKAKVIKTLTY